MNVKAGIQICRRPLLLKNNTNSEFQEDDQQREIHTSQTHPSRTPNHCFSTSPHLQEDGQQNDEDGDGDQDGDEVESDLVGLLALQADGPAGA